MLNLFLQTLCLFLFSMSLVFILIEFRAKFDLSFLHFGIANMLLCLFCAIDIWVQPGRLDLNWTRTQHIIILFFIPSIVWYISLIRGSVRMAHIRGFFSAGLVFSILFSTDLMLSIQNGEVTSNPLYLILFGPYLIGTMVILNIMIIRGLRRTWGMERRILVFHLVGMVILCASGILDLVSLMTGIRHILPLPSITLLGVMTYCVITTLLFAERLSSLVREREETFRKLKSVHQELEDSHALRELGQSTSIINHEIKNFTFAISGYTELARSPKTSETKRLSYLGKIGEVAEKISNFSEEILTFSRSKILHDKAPIRLDALITACIENHFSRRASCFHIVEPAGSTVINGDWGKLEQVIVNLFKNSLEADAREVRISFLNSPVKLIITLEDDGTGCNAEQLKQIFKAFYTTKKNTRGTGLGMSVVRSIVESHGGSINAYSLNILSEHDHGMKFTVTFPIFSEQEQETGPSHHNLIIIEHALEYLPELYKIFKNVAVTPHIMRNPGELKSREFPPERLVILASPESVNIIRQKYGYQYKTHTLITRQAAEFFIAEDSDTSKLQLFSEDFVISRLLKPQS